MDRGARALGAARGSVTQLIANVRFGWEHCARLFKEPNLWELLNEHWRELSIPGGLTPELDPDFDGMIRLENEGRVFVWAARDGDKLVGYIAFFVQPHIHYKSTLHAIEDLFLLSKPYRNGLAGYRMFKTALAALEEMGVQRVFCHTKAHFKNDRGKDQGRFFERLGFFHSENFYVKT